MFLCMSVTCHPQVLFSLYACLLISFVTQKELMAITDLTKTNFMQYIYCMSIVALLTDIINNVYSCHLHRKQCSEKPAHL